MTTKFNKPIVVLHTFQASISVNVWLDTDLQLKKTQSFKAYQTEFFKYCIIVTGSNTKISKTQFIEKNVVISVCHFLFLLKLVLPSPFSTVEFFQFVETVLCGILKNSNATSDQSCRKYVFCFENGFLQVKPSYISLVA